MNDCQEDFQELRKRPIKRNGPEENRKIFSVICVILGLLINVLSIGMEPTLIFPAWFWVAFYSVFIGALSVAFASLNLLFKSLARYFYITAAFLFLIGNVLLVLLIYLDK